MSRTFRLALLMAILAAAVGAACSLNPQPFPPEEGNGPPTLTDGLCATDAGDAGCNDGGADR